MYIVYNYYSYNQCVFSIEKKTCWIRDDKNIYVEAKVEGSGDDGKIIVETADGQVKESLFHLRDD